MRDRKERARVLFERRAAGGGSGDIIAHLYEMFSPKMIRTAYTITGNLPDAEDVVHDVFLHLLGIKKRLLSMDIQNKEAFLLTCTRNKALSYLRRRGSRREAELKENYPDDEAGVRPDDEKEDLLPALERAYEGLAPHQQEALVLRYRYKLTYYEIAEYMGKTPAAAQKMMSRIRKELRNEVEKEMP